MDYCRTGHSKFLILYYIILVTKYRRRLFDIIKIERIFKELIFDFKILEFADDKDHVHLLIESDLKTPPSEIVRSLKLKTTIRCWKKYENYLRQYYWKRKILWSKGKFVSTIGNISKEQVINYIQQQG